MSFVLRMVVREARASWKRLVFFFVCVALGVGGIVAIRSVIQTVRDALTREARTLMAADVLLQSNQEWDATLRDLLERRLAGTRVTARTEAIETATMVRPGDEAKPGARMVELQGVQAAFPLYGRVELDGGQRYSFDLLRNQGALVRPELLSQLDLRVGDTLVIGDLPFTIRGVVLTEPGRRLGMFSFGPRVLVDFEDLRRSGLLRFGSRARRVLMLRLPEADVEPLATRLRADLRDRFVTVRSFRSTEDQIGEDLSRAENYLSLVGFIMAVLGGIGVWSVTRVFVRQKVPSIAVLKCLGATTGQVLAVYLAQVLLLGLAGSALGVLIAGVGLRAVPPRVLAAFGAPAVGLTASAVAQGLGVGLLVSLLFSLVPLLDVRHVKPLRLLRDQSSQDERLPGSTVPGWRRPWTRLRDRAARTDWLKAGAGLLVTAALAGVASWQAASLRIGLVVCGGFIGVAVALNLAGALLVRLVGPLQHAPTFALRHAVVSLRRPGNQTRVVLLAVGLGAFFVIGVRSLQTNLLREFSVDVRADGPDLFLLDIQPDQAAALEQFLAGAPGVAQPRLLPTLRARVTGVRGRTTNLETVEDVRGRGSLAREYVINYRPNLQANERVVAGRFWDGTAGREPEVSVEESIRDRFGIGVGDRVRFDVLGRVVEAKVTSVRHVEWSDARTGGFMFVFRPGLLEQAPQTFIATLRGPADPTARAGLQRALVTRFPNVSAIDIREVVRTVQGVLGNVTTAISVVGAIALLSGLLILVGSVAMTKFQRLHEAAVFKTLGATNGTLAAMLALEYATLGLLAGTVGALASILLSWVVSRRVLDIRWTPAVGVVAAGVVFTMVAVLVVGVVASLDVLRRKPLAILRAE